MNKGCDSTVVHFFVSGRLAAATFVALMFLSTPVFADDIFLNFDLKKTIYGEGQNVKYYEWSKGADGMLTLLEVATPSEGNTTIEYRYNQDKYAQVYDNKADEIYNDYYGYTYAPVKVKKGETASIIDTLFINNASTTSKKTIAGALYNAGNVEEIIADFVSNSVSGSNSAGGAIYNFVGTIGNITGDFIGNSAANSGGDGGAIHNNSGTIGNITGNFIGNIASGPDGDGGGAIENDLGTIGDITGDFIGNSVSSPNSNTVEGGAILNTGNIRNIAGSFIGNSAFSSDFNAYGGAISNHGAIGNITGDFVGNSVSGYRGYGGAIYNGSDSTIGQRDDSGKIVGGIINSSFIGNYAESHKASSGYAAKPHGGAIYTSTDLNIIADNGTSTFLGNYIQTADGTKDYQAIWVDETSVPYDPSDPFTADLPPTPSTLTFLSTNHGSINMYDNINGIDGYTVNITGDKTGTFSLYNDIYNANVKLGNTTLNTINNDVHTYNFNSFTLTGDANMQVDVDLANSTMDRLTASTYGNHTGTLNVSTMHLISDATSDHTEIFFAEPGLKDNVSTTVTEVAYTPIHKYNVNYSNQEDGGYFHFNRAISSNPSDSFNPSVLSTPVATQAGAQSIVNETVHFAFQHMDMFSQLPFAQRIAIINNNKYAINDSNLTPKYNPDFEMINKGFWTKPFTSFERINLHHGPDVDAITYGTLIGFDSNFRELKRGWYNVQSIYGGYNGSQLSYSGVDSTLNGGIAGITETFYKNNFFTAITATAGASVGTSNTIYGNEDFTVLLGGIGAKGGYNFEFKNGKYILQPIMFANYSFVNTFDYTNAAGVRMKSDPLHTFQINPQLKFVANLSNGWQPYASVGLVWNVLNSSKVKADDVILPKMTVDPYVEYGLGLQRNWKERFTGFAQAMVRNGGRNGVALTFGFRWALGKVSEDL